MPNPEATRLPPTTPSDTPLDEVTDALADAGHHAQFQALEGGFVRCLTCGEQSPAAEQSADQLTRLEGASDPADLAIVIPLTCPHCGARGALIANYGPEASEAESDVLLALPRDAAEHTDPTRR